MGVQPLMPVTEKYHRFLIPNFSINLKAGVFDQILRSRDYNEDQWLGGKPFHAEMLDLSGT